MKRFNALTTIHSLTCGVCVIALAGAPARAAESPTPPPAMPPALKMPADYIIGADISWVQQREDRGARFSDQGTEKDILQILKDHGFNYIRLRVFNDPTQATPRDRPYSPQGYCDLPHTITMSRRVKAAGMKLLIDFHYSDSWADPQKQFTPSAWVKLSFDDLVTQMHDWTRASIQQMKDAGVMPDMVQIGNEITPGLMTDRGGSAGNWDQLGRLLKAGLSAVKEVDPRIQTLLHIDKGGDNTASAAWLENAFKQGLAFDVFGESCYARWQGPAEGWKANFEDLARRYPKLKFVMAEVDAQAMQANEIMLGLPNGQGLGTFIWEPTANNAGQALFDNRGAVIPAKMSAYDEVIRKYGRPAQ
jgi:arabinogalactan endo-1,4-beta-galactosidase